MEITVNDSPRCVDDGATVGRIVPMVYSDSRGTAVAVNGKIVKRAEWDSHVLSAGDDVVIIKAAYGG